MKTFLFTWNPNKWQWDDLPQAVYEANAEGRYLDSWSCGATRHISPGDRAFLMRLGVPPKGMMGSGFIVSEPFEGLHWNDERAEHGDTVYRVEIMFDVLSDMPILDERDLASDVLAQHNWFPQASGTHIPETIAAHLESIWSRATGITFEPPESAGLPTLRLEGTKRSQLITTYERNPEAREECLRHHGRRCQVCGLAFEERYGHIGKGFIHVHHVVPVSEIGQEYEVDPLNHLCPVCPNCHAMLHKRTPPLSIDELKGMIQAPSIWVRRTR
jgi:5-methylcytosine-specific restriction protein A